MLMRKIPDIKGLTDLAPNYRKSCVFIFKCTAAGWIELVHREYPSGIINSPSYTPTPFGGYEMICTSSNEHVYWGYPLLDIPDRPEFSIITFMRNPEQVSATASSFAITNWGGVRGWTQNIEDSTNLYTGMTKMGTQNVPFTNLDTGEILTHFSMTAKANNQMTGYVNNESQLNTNTTAFKTWSSAINRVVIGGNYNSASFNNPARAALGPYILIFNRELAAVEIEKATVNPQLLFNLDSVRREYLVPTAGAPPAVTEIPPTLHGLDYQHSVIRASRLGGMLEQ